MSASGMLSYMTAEFCWRYSISGFEYTDKMRQVIESYGKTDFRYLFLRGFKQSAGCFQPVLRDKLRKGHTLVAFEECAERRTVHPYVGGYVIKRYVVDVMCHHIFRNLLYASYVPLDFNRLAD